MCLRISITPRETTKEIDLRCINYVLYTSITRLQQYQGSGYFGNAFCALVNPYKYIITDHFIFVNNYKK